MEKIQAFKLSNGEIVADEKEAVKKQKELDFLSKVRQFSEEHGYHGGESQIYESITENADVLYNILKEYKEGN